MTTCILISTFGCQARTRAQEADTSSRRVHSWDFPKCQGRPCPPVLLRTDLFPRDKIACGVVSKARAPRVSCFSDRSAGFFSLVGGWLVHSRVLTSRRYFHSHITLSPTIFDCRVLTRLVRTTLKKKKLAG